MKESFCIHWETKTESGRIRKYSHEYSDRTTAEKIYNKKSSDPRIIYIWMVRYCRTVTDSYTDQNGVYHASQYCCVAEYIYRPHERVRKDRPVFHV
jgi:hypothetical protein